MSGRSLDHLVSTTKQRERHGKAECFGGLEVDDQLDFGDLDYGDSALIQFASSRRFELNALSP
jgi:hypothetical protein